MRFNLIGLAVHDVNAAAVAFPARDAGGKMLVGVGDAGVVLFLVLVLFGVGSRVATLPEGLDELVAFFVVGKLFESGSFFVGDDPDDVLVEPLLVNLAELLLERLLLFGLLLFR